MQDKLDTHREVIRRLKARNVECETQRMALQQGLNFFVTHLQTGKIWDGECAKMLAIINTSMRPDGME
jgi:hypothetical protein